MKRFIFYLRRSIIFSFLTSCMVGPDYQPPAITIADTWENGEIAKELKPIEKWWELFNDPLLNKYISLATQYNYDLQSAEANILKARAIQTVSASKLFPHVLLDPNATKTYFSKNGPLFAIGQATGDPNDTTSGTTGLPFSVQIPQIQNLFNFLFDASWELDLFGKTRRSMEAASAEIDAAVANKDDLLLSVLAEVAKSYIGLRSFQNKGYLLTEQIKLFQEEQTITDAKLKAGYCNQVDLEQIEAASASAKALLPDATAEIYQAIYALSVLIGQPPETLIDELLQQAPLPQTPTELNLGVRSELLRRRPDIRFAERKLAAATAQIGVSVASFFPAVTLLATGGLQSLTFPKLFEWGSKTWAYGADFEMPLFRGGELVGKLRFSRAEAKMAAAHYQQVVLRALQETEGYLKKYKAGSVTSTEYREMVEHRKAVVTLTKERFLKGLIDKPSLLKSQKELISTELTFLDSRTEELFSLISLYKALGGGWENQK